MLGPSPIASASATLEPTESPANADGGVIKFHLFVFAHQVLVPRRPDLEKIGFVQGYG